MDLDLALDALGDGMRRRIVGRLAAGPRDVGALTEGMPIGRTAVSMHLRVLRDSGFATVRAEGARRLYAVDAEPLREVDAWLDHFRGFWTQHLDALATELVLGRRERDRKEKDT